MHKLIFTSARIHLELHILCRSAH